jgi:hypothetical protein
MAVTLGYVYERAGLDKAEIYDVPVKFLLTLSTLSLDACEPLYSYLYLPLSFTKKSKLVLQEAFSNEAVGGLSGSDIEIVVQKVLRHFEQKIGLDATNELTDWMLCSDNRYASEFVRHLGHAVSDIESGKIQAKLPLRLERFFAMKELLAPPGYPYPEEELLEPEKLKSKWDVKHFAAHYDRVEECNTWNPSNDVGCAADQMQNRIAWENAMCDPVPDEAELDAIHDWVDTYRWKIKNDTTGIARPAANPRAMFISPRLLEEYKARGIIKA